MWVGTDDGATRLTLAAAPGTNVVASRQYFADDGLADNQVNAVTVAPSGTVWFATADGISRLTDPGGADAFQTWDRGDGVPARNIRDIAVAVLGGGGEVAWAATNAGLVRVDSVTEAVQVISVNQGLVSNDVRTVAVLADGSKLLGTGAGAARYFGL